MSLDDASYTALWGITAATGIRPEYLLPVLYHESRFNPAATNGSYHGIGQNSAADIQTYAGVDPTTYLGYPASKQLETVVKGYFNAITKSYGVPKSGVRVYQAEYLPGTLNTAKRLSDVIAASPSAFYTDNPSLDPNKDGVITLGDLASVVGVEAQTSAVQTAISSTYAIDASASLFNTFNPDDVAHIIYGDDFGASAATVAQTRATLLAVGIISTSAVVGYLIYNGFWKPKLPKSLKILG